jgi:FkbM family methyltransferase
VTAVADPPPATDDGTPSRLERAVDRVPFLEKELFLLDRVVRPGMVCVDVGAAGGAHLLVMARRVGPTGRVVGIEPRPGSLRALRALCRLTGVADRTRLLPIALAEGRGRLPLRIPVVPTRAHLPGTTDDTDGAAAFANLPHKAIEVPTRALDDVVDAEGLERVDLVKIDVEGAELAALAGAHRTLDELRPLVLVEADDLHQARYDATAQDVVDAVLEHGYEVFRYRRGELDRLAGRVVEGEDDYVFVPVERPPPLPVHGER